MRLTRAFPLLALAGLAACGGPKTAETGNNVATNEAAPANAAVNASNEAVLGTAPAPTPIAALFDRLGKIRIGATLKELERDGLVVAGQDEPLDEESTCTYATFKDQPDVGVMLDGPRIVRIDIGGPQHETLGVRVGQSEADALKALGGKAKVELHPYTGPEGHYLVLHEKDAPRGMIVETDGKKVESYRFGQWEQVQWIEGCA